MERPARSTQRLGVFVGASKKNFSRAICLGAVSYLALSIDFVREVKAQATLPTVTVIAPKPRQARHVVRTTPRAAPSRSHRAARHPAAPLQRAEPVRYTTPSTGTLGSPAAPYAGGQVATGGQLGFLGNRGVMDMPFNQTSYTAELIQNLTTIRCSSIPVAAMSLADATSAPCGR